ncbi:receiver domain-containing protein [Herbaspirillum rubrisubalbicans]|uniref:Receiver domain-containing protein n=2 Tax=Herbaspirillum rubrisubalbicans TaxID=80842 RepID=A0ABX9BUI2_9BURK|nr:response regulator [Herbaspirillum rubrisubalbicans]RAM61397.1 receiver domain-containing protein [Herbaspirillum rubrisubalbicans]RAN44238.1 receiver domain-containing protein [Herbaspirillum rubrisubalbicans]
MERLMEPTGTGRILLVVEDNVEVSSLFSAVLAIEGYTVIEARNGVKALELMEQHSVDVILTDLKMPVMDGLEFGQKVKADERFVHIPIVLLSATPMTNSGEALQTFSALLTKPCPLEEVILTVNRVQQADAERVVIIG